MTAAAAIRAAVARRDAAAVAVAEALHLGADTAAALATYRLEAERLAELIDRAL